MHSFEIIYYYYRGVQFFLVIFNVLCFSRLFVVGNTFHYDQSQTATVARRAIEQELQEYEDIRNLIMATWSNQMWRTILNRVLRVLSSGPFGRDFQSASVDIQHHCKAPNLIT
ncbi:hypothetical protein DICVIV_13923 [Dictyocaulus viviparus]|uniref:Uncharacterized protein n=1 Tax=Dictyocaulus viviparus TaxID=29172 RepID=A0A0D8X8P9_DICVI|nr:hypothetical protein DICVIV_13923 [Dictyocaulus viviparus]